MNDCSFLIIRISHSKNISIFQIYDTGVALTVTIPTGPLQPNAPNGPGSTGLAAENQLEDLWKRDC